MIVDKHKVPVIKGPEIDKDNKKDVEEVVVDNGLIGAYKAVRKILEGIRENPNDPNSPPYFKTIKMDNGQLSRIKNNKANNEYALAFPAVLIHFIDVYYNQGMSRVSEGKGVMRIHYILNRLNNGDDEFELEGLKVYQRIIEAIESNKDKFSALVSRFQLQYWDQPLTFDDGLQPYWIDYQIWFNDYTTYIYKDYVETYVSHPPFTQHSDQNETANPDHLPDNHDIKFDDSSGFTGTPTE